MKKEKTDMNQKQNCIPGSENNEEGFVLIVALVIMLVLTIIGIAANRNTTTELQIAGNDRAHKETFYIADGGTEIASEILEQNLACITGFSPAKNPINGLVQVETGRLNFWRNSWDHWKDEVAADHTTIPATWDKSNDEYYRQFYPSDTYRDMFMPPNYTVGAPHTNLIAEGVTRLTTGSAIQMAAGYEGKGRGLGTGGAHLFYDIKSQHVGKINTQSVISVFYRHTIGQEGDCYFAN